MMLWSLTDCICHGGPLKSISLSDVPDVSTCGSTFHGVCTTMKSPGGAFLRAYLLC